MGQPERKKPHREVALQARCVSDTKRQSTIATAAPREGNQKPLFSTPGKHMESGLHLNGKFGKSAVI